jgi:3-hydroxyisobutyrate dehydrogenase
MSLEPEKLRVGVIGAGAMGMAMAHNLVQRGYELMVRDVRREVEDQARSLGMQVAASPRELAARCSVIIIVVVNAAQIDEVLSGDAGLLAGLPKNRCVLLCSTIAPDDTARFASVLSAAGSDVIDAPISGGPARALSGTMSMMLAGRSAVLERHASLLEDLAARRFHLGEAAGTAAKAKLVNNLLAGINLVAAAEAFTLGTKLGLEPRQLFELIGASSGASWVFGDRIARALDGDFEPRAATRVLTKDVTLAVELAHTIGHPVPLGRAALAHYRVTLEQGFGEDDDASVIKPYQA